MKNYLCTLLLILSSLSYSQSVRLISSEDIPGIGAMRFDSFTGQDLDKYQGTRAGLTREYGFQKMYVVDYQYQDDKARLEVYIMEDATSAFGIYSVSNAGCLQWKLFSTFSCMGKNGVLVSHGPFFLNVLNVNKTAGGQNFCEQIVKLVINKNPQETWYIPPIFQHPEIVPYINSLKYMEGPLGLSYGAPQLIGLLDNLQFTCFSIKIITPGYAGLLSRIEFPDLTSMSSFVTQAGLNTLSPATPTIAMNNAYRSWYKIDATRLIYLECSSPDLKLSDIIPDRPNPMY